MTKDDLMIYKLQGYAVFTKETSEQFTTIDDLKHTIGLAFIYDGKIITTSKHTQRIGDYLMDWDTQMSYHKSDITLL